MADKIPLNEHIAYLDVTERILLSDFLMRELKFSAEKFKELLLLGALYVNKQRQGRDSLLMPGDNLRVHLYPTRYPMEGIPWKNLIVFQSDDFIVLNKPAKIPVPSTVDNLHDNVMAGLSGVLKIPLFITQRLDRGTTGLLVIAKSKKFQVEFNHLIQDHQLTKKYLALTQVPIPLGQHDHYLSDATKIPKTVLPEAAPGFRNASLIVLGHKSIVLEAHGLTENEIQLLTGRTHQIRAQLAYLNGPIVGDRTYGGEHIGPYSFESFALHSYSLKFMDFEFKVSPPWRS